MDNFTKGFFKTAGLYKEALSAKTLRSAGEELARRIDHFHPGSMIPGTEMTKMVNKMRLPERMKKMKKGIAKAEARTRVRDVLYRPGVDDFYKPLIKNPYSDPQKTMRKYVKGEISRKSAINSMKGPSPKPKGFFSRFFGN